MTQGRTLSRDYKHVKRHTPGGPAMNGWLGFGAGLAVGLTVALGVFLHYSDRMPPEPLPASSPAPASAQAGEEAPAAAPADPAQSLTFYNDLVNQEVEVPADGAERGAGATVLPTGGIGQLHVGGTVGRRRLVLARRDVDLRPLIEAAVAAIRTAAAPRALQFDVAGEPATARVDPQWLTQALLALLTNAVRWTPDGGSVGVRLEHHADAVAITVSDTGAGIAAEHLPDLFEPFSTAGGDLLLHGSGRFELGARGLGLGLATVRAIADAHGGAVTVDSALGAGTRVRLVI